MKNWYVFGFTRGCDNGISNFPRLYVSAKEGILSFLRYLYYTYIYIYHNLWSKAKDNL